MNATEFKQRYLPFHPQLYREPYRLTGNAQDAEDLLQDAYLHLWQRRERLPEGATSAGYLCTVVRHLFASQQRRCRVDATASLDAGITLTADEDATTRLELRERHAQLGQAMAQLSSRERRIVHLHLEEERGYDELALTTGLTPANLRQIITRARRKLKEMLKPTRNP